jgi:integrase
MGKRRGRGEGSITQRADGRWMARVDLGWTDGKRRRKTIYGRTRKAVADQLPKILQAAHQGAVVTDERQTVEKHLQAWLKHKQTRLRPRAFATYQQAVDLHLTPGIGKVAIARLTPQHVDAWFQTHQAAGASARTIRYARAVLRAALNQALRWSLVSRNAAALVDPPRHKAREIQPLTPDEARTLLVAVKEHRLNALVSVATAIGLRLGEALGLRWCDVNFGTGTLSVNQALERSGGDYTVRRALILERRELRRRFAVAPKRSAERRGLRAEIAALQKRWRLVRTTLHTTEPKSARSRRTVRMPAVVVSSLKAHRTRQREDRLAAGAGWTDSGFVFTSPIGTPLDPRNATRQFRAIVTDAALPPIRFHDLRHTAATLLLAQGVDARTIMETLGHSQISLTMNTYSHVLPALQAEAAAKMDAILTRGVQTSAL